MANVIIRDAVAADAPAIAVLEKECFPKPWSEDAILYDIEKNKMATVLVAELDGEFAGYVDTWTVVGESQINNIAVKAFARRQHVGEMLMQTLIERLVADEVTELTLEVRISNTPALQLYSKLGFEHIGRRKAYYLDDGEDGHILRKGL